MRKVQDEEIMKEFKRFSKESKCFLWIEDGQPVYEATKIIDRTINEKNEFQYSILSER